MRLGSLFALGLLLASTLPLAGQKAPADSFAAKLVEQLNAERKKAGAPPVEIDKGLMKACQGYIEVVAKAGDWKAGGSPFDRVDSRKVRVTAFGGAGKDDAAAFLRTYLGKEASRKQFLDPDANRLGAGVARKGGRTYVAVILGEEKAGAAGLNKIASDLLTLVNAERKKAKVSPLKTNETLTKVAVAHAENMARQNKLEHVLDGVRPEERIRKLGYQAAFWGENVAQGDLKPAEVMRVWMNSAPHRKNILSSTFRDIGIGMARSKKTGQLYFCQVFGASR